MPQPARLAVRQGARVLVNLTNDMWFGPTRAPYQHRNGAAFRAVENRRALVRVTNTGVTSIIDALGREQAALPIYQRGTLVDDVPALQHDHHLPAIRRLVRLAVLCGGGRAAGLAVRPAARRTPLGKKSRPGARSSTAGHSGRSSSTLARAASLSLNQSALMGV